MAARVAMKAAKAAGSGERRVLRRAHGSTVPGTEKPQMERREAPHTRSVCAHKEWTRHSVLHPLGFFRGAKESEDGVPGAAKNTGDDACLLFVN